MERLTLTMKHAATYRQLRPLYDQYRQPRDKEKFLRGHELTARRTALQSEYRKAQQKEREYDTLNQNVRILLERSEDVVLPKESSNELE